MEPGRKLDALVSEKVMGWERVGHSTHWKPEHKKSKDYPGTIIDNWDSKGPHDFLVPPNGDASRASLRAAFCGCEGDLDIPQYSEDISAAWEILDHLRAQNPAFSFELKESYDGVWDCSIGVGLGCNSDTAPYAICMAALDLIDPKNE